MSTPRASWHNTTHDWASTVDLDHLEHIRQNPAAFAPSGILHLIFEVVAYAADEAECGNGGHCRITLYPDGSVAVADDGRGTDTRLDEHGCIVKKPVMATKDLRFFDHPDAPFLPDTHPRRGMSVVAALSTWLVHTNRRHNGPGPSGTNTACPPPTCNRSPTTTRPEPPSTSSPRGHCVWQAAPRPTAWHGSPSHGHTSP
ncbi:hypothetical protein GCM10010228_58790 [Streptomyces massasporeus]|nr:hypothetical protein GCM10010228_58790 [Streptomyces massasporeus]